MCRAALKNDNEGFEPISISWPRHVWDLASLALPERSGLRVHRQGGELVRILDEKGFGKPKPRVAEKVMRVVHTAAFLTALLGHEGQKIFWMSDHDAIFDKADVFAIFQNVLGLYTAKTFDRLGGARPFKERSTDVLDLLSAADMVAGSLAQYFTGRDDVGEQKWRY